MNASRCPILDGEVIEDDDDVVRSRLHINNVSFPCVCSRFHKLVINDVKPEDAGDYTFIPDGYALSLSAKLNFLGERDRMISKW